jgi:enamine deaminase RidA (YjgF/YER057c/UK114 family)
VSAPVRHLDVDALAGGKPYSTATIVGDLVFLSGCIPRGASAQRSFAHQVDAVIADVETALAACGSSLGSIVRSGCYLTDAADFDEFNELYRSRIPAPFPARTTIVTTLAAPSVRFEMDVIALRDRQPPAAPGPA